MAFQLLRELLSSSTADGSRTNALNHLQWMLAVVLAAVLGAAWFKLPGPILAFLVVVFVVLLVSYLVTHFYFMVTNPDALRSERFTIEKMAIERGMVGDSGTGLRLPGDSPQNIAIAVEAKGRRS